MPGKTILMALISHKGCVRGNNEDNFFANGDYMPLEEMDAGVVINQEFKGNCHLFGVLDGMGGGNLGERASMIVAKNLTRVYMDLPRVQPLKALREFAFFVNDEVHNDGVAHNAEIEGSTMAVLAFKGAQAFCANVGDSRVYLYRGGELKQLSMDHSEVGIRVRNGEMTEEQARKSSQNNLITQYIGMNKADVPEHYSYRTYCDALANDRYLICSDGLCDMISNKGIQAILAGETDLAQCCRKLVATALENGGKDNVTCMLLQVMQ